MSEGFRNQESTSTENSTERNSDHAPWHKRSVPYNTIFLLMVWGCAPQCHAEFIGAATGPRGRGGGGGHGAGKDCTGMNIIPIDLGCSWILTQSMSLIGWQLASRQSKHRSSGRPESFKSIVHVADSLPRYRCNCYTGAKGEVDSTKSSLTVFERDPVGRAEKRFTSLPGRSAMPAANRISKSIYPTLFAAIYFHPCIH